MWKRWVIMVFCIGLACTRFIWPDAKIDTVTVLLVAIAAGLFVLPELRQILPYVRKISVAGAEIELNKQIAKEGQEVEKAQESLSKRPDIVVSENMDAGIEQVLQETSKDPRAALLLVAARMEQQVRRRIEEAGLLEDKRFMPLSKAIEVGVNAGLFPQEVLPAFRGFWTLRNRVAHGEAFDVETSAVLSLVSLGTELLKMISTEKRDGQTHP